MPPVGNFFSPFFILRAPFDLAHWNILPGTNLWLAIVAFVKLGQNGEIAFVFGFSEGGFVLL